MRPRQTGQGMTEYIVIVAAITSALLIVPAPSEGEGGKNVIEFLIERIQSNYRGYSFAMSAVPYYQPAQLGDEFSGIGGPVRPQPVNMPRGVVPLDDFNDSGADGVAGSSPPTAIDPMPAQAPSSVPTGENVFVEFIDPSGGPSMLTPGFINDGKFIDALTGNPIGSVVSGPDGAGILVFENGGGVAQIRVVK